MLFQWHKTMLTFWFTKHCELGLPSLWAGTSKSEELEVRTSWFQKLVQALFKPISRHRSVLERRLKSFSEFLLITFACVYPTLTQHGPCGWWPQDLLQSFHQKSWCPISEAWNMCNSSCKHSWCFLVFVHRWIREWSAWNQASSLWGQLWNQGHEDALFCDSRFRVGSLCVWVCIFINTWHAQR